MSESDEGRRPEQAGQPQESGSPGLPGMEPAGPPPGGLADAAAGQQPAAGGWMDTYLDGATGQSQGPPMAQNLAQLMMPPGMTGPGGGMFRIDPERAPQAIADLRHAADLLQDEIRTAEDLANYQAPGLDAVSRDAVRIISEAAIGEQGSLRAALVGALAEFNRQADKLEADLKAYLQVDEVNIPTARAIQL